MNRGSKAQRTGLHTTRLRTGFLAPLLARLAFVLAVGSLIGFAIAAPADCAWCPAHACLGDSTCGRCTCVITGGETKGRCQARAEQDRSLPD